MRTLPQYSYSCVLIKSVSSKVAIQSSCPTIQFLNGTNAFSELVSAHGSEPLSSPVPLTAKVREFGELWREKYTRAP